MLDEQLLPRLVRAQSQLRLTLVGAHQQASVTRQGQLVRVVHQCDLALEPHNVRQGLGHTFTLHHMLHRLRRCDAL